MAGFGKAFDEAFRPADTQAAAGAYDVIKQKIVEDQKKSTESAEATTINHAAIAAAIASGDKNLMKNTALMVDSIGNSTPEASKLIFSSIQDKIKAQQTQQNQQDSYAMRSSGLQPTPPGQMNDWNKSQAESNMVQEMKSINPSTTAQATPPVSINGQPYSPIPGFETPAQAKQKALLSDAQDISKGIKSGITPPDVTGLGRTGLAGAVEAQLAREGYNLTKAKTDWISMKTFAQNLNSSQQIVMNQGLDSVDKGIDVLKQLSSNVERGGFVPANNLIIKSALSGVELNSKGLKPDQVQAATKYVTQLNLMRDQLAVAFMKGGTPTDKALELTDAILKPSYGKGQLNAALDQVRFDVNIRRNAISSSQPQLVGGNQNQQAPPSYNPSTEKLQQNSKGEYRVVKK